MPRAVVVRFVSSDENVKVLILPAILGKDFRNSVIRGLRVW